jgi:hypothetical protein
MYVILKSQIRDYFDKYQVKDTYNLTGTEVNTIARNAVSTLSILIKTKGMDTTDANVDIYTKVCDIVLNLYFGQNIDVSGAKFSTTIQDEMVRNAYAKSNEKLEKESKKISDVDFKQKQIASLGSNAGYQKYRKDFYDKFLQGRESRTTDPKDYYNIISTDRFTTLINQRIVSDGFSAKHPNSYKNLSN